MRILRTHAMALAAFSSALGMACTSGSSGPVNVTGGATATGGSGGGRGFGGGMAGETGGGMGGAGAGGTGMGGSGSGGAANGGSGGAGGGSAGAGTGGAGVGGSAGASDALLVPAHGALLGAFVGTGTFTGFETTLGRKLAIVHTFVGWTDDYTARLPGDLASGRIPLITWEAWNNGVGAPLDDVVGGTYDAMIRSRAMAVKNLGQKFFLRWGHEMNGNWYPWSGASNGANAAATAKFIAAYRHTHDIFVASGATNVLWVFCPNVDSVPGDAWNQWSNYYPGDAYVDWMGFDGYNWGTVMTTSTWQTFPAIAARIYTGLAAKGKPIMIPETASAELGGDKGAWIDGMLPALENTFPAVKALLWFEMNKETDWRIESSLAAQSAFQTMAV